MDAMASPTSGGGTRPRGGRSELVSALAVYTVLRFGLLVVLTAVLVLVVPFLFALIIAVILQLPLSWLLFARQRSRVNALLAASRAERRDERARLRSQLHGDDAALPDDQP